MEKYEFIKLMLRSRNLSVNDKKRLLLLATQEIEKKDIGISQEAPNSPGGVKPKDQEQVHAPKDTAAFLSLFNHEDGFKFLTHAFDPGAEMEYSQLIKLAREKFSSVTSKDSGERLNIPTSLYALMRSMLFGGKDKTWMDCNRKKHADNFACSEWTQWANNNPLIHVLSNESIKNTIMDFRSTIRMVLSDNSDSRLETIINRQIKKHANLSIETENLENNSDFYTYVCYLEFGIERILRDLSKYSKDAPKVKVLYESSRNGDYKQCTIRVIHYGSFSIKPLEQ